MRRILLAVLLCAALASPARAHEGLHEQIEAVTRAIAREPRNAALYLKRGELHRLHREWKDAQSDYERARALDRELYAVDLAQGRMLFDSGRAREAAAVLQRYVRIAPRNADGHVALARALMSTGRAADAVASFERALPPRPEPELALEYVAALAAAGRRNDALRYLDGLEPLVSYLLAAIDLEMRAGKHAAALRRIEAAEAGAAVRKDEWLERRGDLLMKMGRTNEARAAYQSALDAIARLPPERRRTRAIAAMERRLKANTER
jgi:tetratricopeptide (TPR) repeat protein